jgi:hypothetical protein
MKREHLIVVVPVSLGRLLVPSALVAIMAFVREA